MASRAIKCSQFVLQRRPDRRILMSCVGKTFGQVCSVSTNPTLRTNSTLNHALRTNSTLNPYSTKFFSTNLDASKEIEDNNHPDEKVVGPSEAHEFQAETAELLNIVAKSLYSESEVFVRELVSNASDALEKLRYSLLTSGGESAPPGGEISIATDKQANTFTIADSGAGMTKQELLLNIGTIARSGSKAFLRAAAEKGDGNSSIIGQFGVGFYSAFMVGDKVTVYTKSQLEGSTGYKWTSEGGVSYEVSEAENVQPGTKIVVQLKPDCREFANEDKVKKIVEKHSAFVGFPVKLNGSVLNSVKPLWTLEAREISDEQHLAFFRHLCGDSDHFLYKLFYKTDAPLSIRSIFYVPGSRPTIMDMTREGKSSGVSLYSRRVLVQPHTEHLVPKWLRFLRGVVDSEDVPLNLSRELLQNSALIRKLREAVTGRIVRFFVDQSRRDPEKYREFHDGFKLYLTEGVLGEEEQGKREEVAQLLRYESSALPSGEVTGIRDYVSRMEDGQRNIFYLCAPTRELAESSPYFEAVKGKNLEVLFCYDSYDEVTMLQLKQFDSKQLFSLENEVTANLYQPSTTSEPEVTTGGPALFSTESTELTDWAKAALDTKVTDVKVTDKLDKHPAMVTVWEMGSVRHYLRSQHLTDPKGLSDTERSALFKPTLQLNSGHPVVIKLSELVKRDEVLATAVIGQLFDNAMIAAGLTDDARPMVSRLNDLLTMALEKH